METEVELQYCITADFSPARAARSNELDPSLRNQNVPRCGISLHASAPAAKPSRSVRRLRGNTFGGMAGKRRTVSAAGDWYSRTGLPEARASSRSRTNSSVTRTLVHVVFFA
jgi:hypothetical protein